MIVSYAEDPSRALEEAVRSLQQGGLVVVPTDTVYGIGADAFSPAAVERLLRAKGRGRQMPPPVLVGDLAAVDSLAAGIPAEARALMAALWPGALTIILRAHPSLTWDLGETGGTVALRMPANEAALALLRRWGPLAVTSANLTGQAPAQDIATAEGYFGDAVAVYIDGGPTPGPVASTIVDLTGDTPQIVRHGVLTADELGGIVPALLGHDGA